MITKGSEDYKKASELANKIQEYAKCERWSNASYFDIAFEKLGEILNKVSKLDCFAANVAKTIDENMNPYGKIVAYCSSKQAWILACALIENKISI